MYTIDPGEIGSLNWYQRSYETVWNSTASPPTFDHLYATQLVADKFHIPAALIEEPSEAQMTKRLSTRLTITVFLSSGARWMATLVIYRVKLTQNC